MAGVMGFGSPPQMQQQPSMYDRLMGGLLGAPNSYGGLLTPEEQKAAQQKALLAMGAQLMAAGGPSDQRVSFGQALAPAIMAGQQAQQQSGQDALQAMLLKAKLQQAKEQQVRPANVSPGGAIVDPLTGKVIYQNPASQRQQPSAIEEYEYWKNLKTQEERDAYLTVKRSMQPYQLGEKGGGKVVFNRATGQYEQISTAGEEAAGAGQIAGATAGAKVAGEAQTQAQIDMPLVVDKANEALGLIDQLRNHPGRRMATGGTRLLQTQRMPGTSAYDFDVMRSQVSGQQFLQAYETLKGGGQITEVEGQEAKNAIARMDAAQSEGAYLKALEDYERIIRKGVERAAIKAGGGRQPPVQSQGAQPGVAPRAPSNRSREDILKQYGL